MHTTQKDTTYTKIFVGGLPYHTTDSSLKKYFEVFGEIEEAVVITDRQTGKSRGYGFVSIAHITHLFCFTHNLTKPCGDRRQLSLSVCAAVAVFLNTLSNMPAVMECLCCDKQRASA